MDAFEQACERLNARLAASSTPSGEQLAITGTELHERMLMWLSGMDGLNGPAALEALACAAQVDVEALEEGCNPAQQILCGKVTAFMLGYYVAEAARNA